MDLPEYRLVRTNSPGVECVILKADGRRVGRVWKSHGGEGEWWDYSTLGEGVATKEEAIRRVLVHAVENPTFIDPA